MTRQPSRSLLAAALAALLVAASATSTLSLTWGPAKDFSIWGETRSLPGAVAVTSNGWIHTVYAEFVIGKIVVTYRRSKDGGQTWSPPFKFGTGPDSQGTQVAISAFGEFVDLVWTGGGEVRYRGSRDSGVTWGRTRVLTSSSDYPRSPRIARDGAGHVLVTYTHGNSGNVAVMASSNGAQTFGAPKILELSLNLVAGGALADGFAVPVLGNGFGAVVYQAAARVIKIRRTANWGSTWTAATTITTDASGYQPGVTAAGSTILVGYARSVSGDAWTLYRRSTNKGVSFGPVGTLAPQSGNPAFEPVFGYSASKWFAIFERCTAATCNASRLILRESADGLTWTAAETVSTSAHTYAAPSGVVRAGGTNVFYTGFDASLNEAAIQRRAP